MNILFFSGYVFIKNILTNFKKLIRVFVVVNLLFTESIGIDSKIDDILVDKPQSLIVHAGNNDVNLDDNVKKIVNKTKKKSPNIAIYFPNVIVSKDRKKLEKSRTHTNSRIKNYCKQKNIGLQARI